MEKYTPTPPTKTQIAANAIRDMFFNKHYKGVVPVKDIEIIKNSNSWIAIYTKRALLEAIHELSEEKYMNLDEEKRIGCGGCQAVGMKDYFQKKCNFSD